jgi:hypothetical protein
VEYRDDRNRILIGNKEDQKGKSINAGETNWLNVKWKRLRAIGDVVQLVVDVLAEAIGQHG